MTKTAQGAKPSPRKQKKPVAKKKAAGVSARAKTVKVQEAEVALTDLQQRFVEEYLVDLNATQAAIRANYSEKTARQMGAENLSKPVIQAAIAAARLQQQERTQITADRVLREAWNQVTADARELTQLYIGCCRYCHGFEHRYQRTSTQFDADYAEWLVDIAADKGEFNEMGGPGFNPNAEPHPSCPECAGDGVPRVILMDTRKLSDGARSLFAGVKQTKFGIEIQMHSKDAAMEKLFKHLGLYERDNQQRVDPLASLLHSIASGNSSGFTPIARDPERDIDRKPGGSSFEPVQNVAPDEDN
ncbi:terminase small subunit [Pseudomonas nicosulfuronedens]|uniref:terminase small subunit n=1 Tax=Pseudomonas nicosulfuronedens TaxID=2571105 RepID=UPI00244C36C8|nr:terminase small subunit [Pseudomonas nicosulfuronedens]MDH1009989.1 terminase small subunit [Pseudomonas nicosulfuronedens]MDH1978965.1 terminase small subunit [Pseudomonas nicosulfuronedens]MDH2028356.1 terminase small subunit [Pseudomonas nicosulfuronedens]